MKYLLILLILIQFAFAQKEYGICEIDTLDEKSAQECIEKVLQKEPKNIRCTVKLANLYMRQGKLSQGFKLINKAYKINPEAVKKSSVSSILPFALKIYALQQQATTQKDKSAWNEVGDSFYDMGVYKEALEAYKNSIEIDSTQEDISLKLALCYKQVGQTYSALEQLKELLHINPKNFYANYYLGKILKYMVKDVVNSKKYFLKARAILESDATTVSSQEYSKFLSDIIYELSI